jgi:hypothetical protein
MPKLSEKLKRRIVIAVTSEQYGKELIDAIENIEGSGEVLNGTGVPSNALGDNGDLYIDLSKLSTTFQLGDTYLVTYRYKAAYIESKVRSEIAQGDEFSYFVRGKELIFGAKNSFISRMYFN